MVMTLLMLGHTSYSGLPFLETLLVSRYECAALICVIALPKIF